MKQTVFLRMREDKSGRESEYKAYLVDFKIRSGKKIISH